MHSLSWDLHIHPGPPEEGRWGDGEQVRRAAREAGVTGFVWKSHRGAGTYAQCQKLPRSAPYAMPSITLNPEVGPADLARALHDGVRWVWGPSRPRDGTLAWDLPLPDAWAEMRDVLAGWPDNLVLSTSHLGPPGRSEFALLARSSGRITCSVTHSLNLPDTEVHDLADLGAVFEADLFTMFRPVTPVPPAALPARAELCLALGAVLYLSSDAGQASTGDPYRFVARCLAALDLPDDLRDRVAVTGPLEVAARVFAEAAQR